MPLVAGVCASSSERCHLWTRSSDSLALSHDLSFTLSRDLSLARSRDRSLARSWDLSLDRLFSRMSSESSLVRLVG